MKIFISHSAEDKPLVRRLLKALEGAGASVWVDEAQLVPGAEWRDPVDSAIRNADAFVVLIGPHQMSPWARAETSAALARAAEAPEALKIVPVLLPGVDRQDIPPILKDRRGLDLTFA